ncbi:MAG: hypothetical protein NTV30_08920 [Chloroflexi bacterium]|nr:hypothetical protein [Chloroflexota bacterium]
MGIEKFRRKVVGTKADFIEQIVCLKGTLSATVGGGGVYSLVNPLGAGIIISHLILDITTATSATPVTLSAGLGSTATTSADNLIDDLVIGSPTAAAVYNSGNDKGTNGAASRKWISTYYLTITASATPTAMVGYVYVYYRIA